MVQQATKKISSSLTHLFGNPHFCDDTIKHSGGTR